MKLLMISTDRKIFEKQSPVALRQAEYAKNFEEIHIIIFAKDMIENNEIAISPNCFVYSTRSWSRWFYPFDAIRLGRFIIKRRGITNITCQDPFLTAMAGISLKRQSNIPLEIQIHTDIGSPNFTYTLGNKIRKSLALSYLPKADSIRVVSNKIKDYLVNKLSIDESKIIVKPIAVDIEKIKNTPVTIDLHKKYSQFDKIVLVASRLEPEKNIELAINSWKEVVKQLPKSGLIIVGNGSMEKRLKRLVNTFGIEGNVVFENWADHETLISYYKTADLFLSTSLFEGYGMTLVEAKASGCKVISTNVGIAKEIGIQTIDYIYNEPIEKIAMTISQEIINALT